jgi:hypothetical protein
MLPAFVTERIGINAVATAITKLGLIWRETPTGDVSPWQMSRPQAKIQNCPLFAPLFPCMGQK